MNSLEIPIDFDLVPTLTCKVLFDYTPADPGRIHPVDSSYEPIGEEVEIIEIYMEVSPKKPRFPTRDFLTTKQLEEIASIVLSSKEEWL